MYGDPSSSHALLRVLVASVLSLPAFPPATWASAIQEEAADVRALIETLKRDPRGPYQSIRWFCPDGTIRPPAERCDQPGGIQHAVLKDEVDRLRARHHLFLGQILAGTDFEDFLDVANQSSRLKQYQLEKFLQAADDGWILRRAQFYRGAVQAEDEEAWGKAFLEWLMAQDGFLESEYFLARQIARDLPHEAAEDRTTRIRELARAVADVYPRFMDVRIKIHGRPDRSDVDRVKEFRRAHTNEMPRPAATALFDLERELEAYYASADVATLQRYLSLFPVQSSVGFQLRRVMGILHMHHGNGDGGDLQDPSHLLLDRIRDLAHLLWVVRQNLVEAEEPALRLAMMDLSLDAEALLFKAINEWQPTTLRELLDKSYLLAKAAAGAGFLEIWEWESVEPLLFPPHYEETLSVAALLMRVESTLRAVEWGAGMVRANYDPVVERFSRFEPLAMGFIDDRVRSSILLAFGAVASRLSEVASRYTGVSNRVMDIPNQGRIRGLSSGIAVGELQVIDGPPEGVQLDAGKIYILLRAPSDLKPVAGIATVSQGNAVSHVQLLARNLAIPNAVVSLQNLRDLARYSGLDVFYAVSPHGTVLLKRATDMTPEERALVTISGDPSRSKISVPLDEIDLENQELIRLSSLRAIDSGRMCGPKAANLGELSRLFPERVPPGLVVPFGVYRRHLEQSMPGTDKSYWEEAQELFSALARASDSGDEALEGEAARGIFDRLEELRGAVERIDLLPELEERLERRFREVFGFELGELQVFIRSDTNMEDLPDFTGAGLNLTVGNIRDKADILQAIRDVWASPYSERSVRWRQRILENPQEIYPSILILPSVSVEKSGVMITTGVSTGSLEDITVAFNWGGAGAVQGQVAETYLLRGDNTDVLLFPARELLYNYLQPGGGIRKRAVSFDRPILSRSERFHLRRLAREIQSKLAVTEGWESRGPYDVELGFWNEQLWLFQVRPFVENQAALSSAYLTALDGTLPVGAPVSLDLPLEAR